MSTQVPVSTPRLSASLIVINAQNEVLLVQRNPKSSAFASMHVFPEGNYDAEQDQNLKVTAIRETFEETGLLLASSKLSAVPNRILDEARSSIHARKQRLSTFLDAYNLQLRQDALMPFSRWTTPPTVPRRFHTQFYLTFLTSTPSAGPADGVHTSRLPTPDGGQEVVSARFVRPRDALSLKMMPPQFYLLSTLADILQGETTSPLERSHVEELSQGAFGRMRVHPLGHGKDSEGRTILTYEGDETRGGKEGRLHRSLVRNGKDGTVEEVTLQRNFDIFTEIEEHGFNDDESKAIDSMTSKL